MPMNYEATKTALWAIQAAHDRLMIRGRDPEAKTLLASPGDSVSTIGEVNAACAAVLCRDSDAELRLEIAIETGRFKRTTRVFKPKDKKR